MVLIALEDKRDVQGFLSKARDTDGYLYYHSRESREDCVTDFMSMVDIPCYVFTFFSIVIGAVIVSTMNLITIAQRRKKYAALYVLGTSLSEFLGMELPEVVLQFAMTVLLGSAPAILCAKAMLRQMSSSAQEFVVVDPLLMIGISAAAVAAYLLVGVLVTLRAIRNMDYMVLFREE